jgi:hypothetical protein
MFSFSVFGAAIAFIWSAIQFIWLRRKEQEAHEFETFHQLIKDLVSPEDKTESMWLDRQVAVVFELRHFPRYYEVVNRILTGLRKNWNTDNGNTRLIEEIDLTLGHISTWQPNYVQRWLS